MSTARALQAAEDAAALCQPGPAKRKRLLVLPTLPSAQQPCGASKALRALTVPALSTSGTAPHPQAGVATPAGQSAMILPISTPLAKQSKRQLRAPFAHPFSLAGNRGIWQGPRVPGSI